MCLGPAEQGVARERICDFEKDCFDVECQESLFASSCLFFFFLSTFTFIQKRSPSLWGLVTLCRRMAMCPVLRAHLWRRTHVNNFRKVCPFSFQDTGEMYSFMQ